MFIYRNIPEILGARGCQKVPTKCHSKNQRAPEADSKHCERESEYSANGIGRAL